MEPHIDIGWCVALHCITKTVDHIIAQTHLWEP